MPRTVRDALQPALALLLAAAAQAEVVYSQPAAADPDRVGLGWYSTSEPRPTRNFKHADNFTLSNNTLVQGVRWWGLTEGLTDTTLANFDAFTIEFYTSRTLPNGNIRPLDLIASETFVTNETTPTATGRSSATGAGEYMQLVSLSIPLDLIAGRTYWISISARSIDPAGDVWQWQDSDDADTLSSSFSYAQNRWLVLQDTDSAFELIAIPAPGAGALLLIGAPLLAQRRRSTRR